MPPDNNIYDLSTESKTIINIIKPLLYDYKNLYSVVQIILEETKKGKENQKYYYDQLKECCLEGNTDIKKNIDFNSNKLEKLISRNEEILIGNTIGEIGGIKKEIGEISKSIKTKTPWYIIVTAIGVMGTLGVSLLIILEKLLMISKLLSALPK